MDKLQIPDLTFPSITYGSLETPFDLKIFLYKGASQARKREVPELIQSEELGSPIVARLPLIATIHSVLLAKLTGGGSRHTLEGQISRLRRYYKYADSFDLDPTESNAHSIFVDLIESFQQRQRLKSLTAEAVYEIGYKLATVLSEALSKSSRAMLRSARLRKPKKRKRALGTEADKQSLQDAFAFGSALLDIIERLTPNVIRGPLPIDITFRNGAQHRHMCGLPFWYDPGKPARDENKRRIVNLHTSKFKDTSARTRFPAINLRMTAEILVFIAQTGINLAQATSLPAGRFSYQSHHDGYLVRRIYKGRKKGEVEFEIYSEYRPFFESYLAWRSEIFPDSPEGLLFPFLAPPGKTVQTVSRWAGIKRIMREIGVPFIGARDLRGTRVNWLLRRSDDPELAAEAAQHTVRTLLTHYQRPHHQRALVEATKFWLQTDPSITPPGPGACVRKSPEPVPDIPQEAPTPDCANPAGCLFCMHNRDIDSLDHVWSLTTYRHLKSLEQAKYLPIGNSKPAARMTSTQPKAVIVRITDRLKGFEESSGVRKGWVKEAIARVDEEHYHPRWDGFVQLAEL